MRLLVMMGVLYLGLFAFNSLARTRHVSPDSMNYINVASNIAAGKGITTPTLGFAQPAFSIDDPIPQPFTMQAPFYAVAAAVFIRTGMPPADAALIVSAICYGLILCLTYLLTSRLYQKNTAILAVGLMAAYSPLHLVSSFAWSEPTGLMFLFLAFYLMVLSRDRTDLWLYSAGAGLATGLAFASRWALLPLFGIGLLFFLMRPGQKQRISGLLFYIIGFAVPAGLIFVRNYLHIGKIMPSLNPPPPHLQLGYRGNIARATENLGGTYSSFGNPEVQIVVLAVVLCAFGVILVIRRNLFSGLREILLAQDRYLWAVWSVGYLAFLVFQRTRGDIDMDQRMIVPAGVGLVIIFAALMTKSFNPKPIALQAITAALLLFAIGGEIKTARAAPVYITYEAALESERMRWVERHTTNRDLLIGNNNMDLPYFLGKPYTMFFARYGLTDYPDYEKIIAYCRRHRMQFARIYIVLRLSDQYRTQEDWQRAYGPFFTSLIFDPEYSRQYPKVIAREKLEDARVFEIQL